MSTTPLPPTVTRTLLSLALAGLANSSAFAQNTPSPDDSAILLLAQNEATRETTRSLQRQFVIRDGNESRQFAFNDTGPERIVKGAPYCADAIHETSQWLPDANGTASNRIVQQTRTKLCRDGEGRTRQELDRDGRKLVLLRDPVAREEWMLDPERKTARRLPELGALPGLDDGLEGAEARRNLGERVREWARDFSERARAAKPLAPMPPGPPGSPATPPAPAPGAAAVPPVPPAPVIIMRHEGAASGSMPMVHIIRRTRGPDGNIVEGREATGVAPPLPPTVPPVVPPVVQFRALTLAPRGPGSTSPLGSKDIEGLRANGERTSWTIEAGKLGNEKPIAITREVWTSPELMVTLQSRDYDPRSGEVAYRLVNVKRGEPDAALMRVPADFGKSGVRVPARGAAPGASAAG